MVWQYKNFKNWQNFNDEMNVKLTKEKKHTIVLSHNSYHPGGWLVNFNDMTIKWYNESQPVNIRMINQKWQYLRNEWIKFGDVLSNQLDEATTSGQTKITKNFNNNDWEFDFDNMKMYIYKWIDEQSGEDKTGLWSVEIRKSDKTPQATTPQATTPQATTPQATYEDMSQNWFQQLFGFNESNFSYDEVKSKFKVTGNELISKVNNKKFIIGDFKNLSVSELRSISKEVLIKQPGIPTFECIEVGDIFLLHSKEENRGALFQGASQFNCLEFPYPTMIPENGITIYMNDATQGPACALATAPGTLYRNYFVPTTCGEETFVGQTDSCQINNLDLIQNYLKTYFGKTFVEVKNGYTFAKGEDLKLLNEILSTKPNVKNDLIDLLKVGFHRDLEVVFSKRWTQKSEQKPFLVSQVYSSALSIGYAKGGNLWHPLAEIILNATYEAIIYIGMLNYLKTGNPKVYLTLIGGGFFGNPPKLISAAIKRAVLIANDNKYPLEIICGFFKESHINPYYSDLCNKKWMPKVSMTKLSMPNYIRKFINSKLLSG